MDHQNQVYEQIMEVTNSTTGAEYQQLVQEIVVQNDHIQESSMASDMPSIEIMLPNDCVNMQEQENVVTCNPEGVMCNKQEENVLLQQENVSQANDSLQCETTYNVHQEVKMEEFLVQNQTKDTQECYEMNHSVTTTKSEIIASNSEVPETNANKSVPETSCNQSFDDCNNDQSAISEVEIKAQINEFPEQSISHSQNVESTSEPTSTNADIEEPHLQQDNHCTSEADTVYSTQSAYISKNELADSSVAANIEFIVETSGSVAVSNSDNVSDLSELNSVGSSQKNHMDEQHIDAVPESSKRDLDQAQTKPDTTNDDGYNEDDDNLEMNQPTQSQDGHNKVIQDIFNDWQDENIEEELHHMRHQQDAIEAQLQSILNDISSPVSKPIERRQSTDKSDGRVNNKSSKGMSKDSTTNHSTKIDLDAKSKHSSRPGVKVPGVHLTSQIASTAEVNEVLKERLKEKRKDLQTPKTADIVFVKKITQRLSSQLLAAAPVLPVAPLPSETQDVKRESDSDKAMSAAADNNELLAILEGDVDPDWSDLRSQSSIDENNKVTSTVANVEMNVSGNKIDASTERELALKQLMELPHSSKKSSPNTSKKGSKKSPKQSHAASKEDDTQSPMEDENAGSQKKRKSSSEKVNAIEVKPAISEIPVEESRSGRKRKLTEKARELTVKKQKIIKNRKSESDCSNIGSPKPEPKMKLAETTKESRTKKVDETKLNEDSEDTKNKGLLKSPKVMPTKQEKVEEATAEDETPIEKVTEKVDHQDVPKAKGLLKKSRIGLVKKDAPISKKKLAVKNMIRQKKVANAAKIKSQLEKPVSGGIRGKKSISEIDKLLQDEGIVNMLFDAEQSDSRHRLVPITKSQKKIMDIEKAERELKMRTKLVRNSVLKMRAGVSTTVTPRARRSLTTVPEPTPEKKVTPTKPSPPSPQPSASAEFIIPAKIRNAADASRIIRRHSSSSFSSASGASPRVSIDLTNPSELAEIETLSKKKLPADSSSEKKGKKKVLKTDSESESPNKKEPVKKVKTNTNSATANKSQPKVSKKGNKRNSFDSLLEEKKDEVQTEPPATSNNRKKGTKVTEGDKSDSKTPFINKEINVRQHGHLVQLTLTPSTATSEIRNAITLQIINEICETLSLLKNDDNCRVVLFTTTGTSFCDGLDLSYLLHSNKEERKHRADTMAKAVKELIKALATFNKPLVAGVQGSAVGLGVTMLPLFDLVIASDKATFSTPYAKLGQLAEGASVLTLSHSISSAIVNELLLGGRVITANEALRAGLVSRVLWPDKFQGELLPSLKAMSEQSLQSMEATKAFLRHNLRKKLDGAVDSESLMLALHWCTPECQDAIKSFISNKQQ